MIVLDRVIELLLAVFITHVSPVLETQRITLVGGVVVAGPFVEGGKGVIRAFPGSPLRIRQERLEGESVEGATQFVFHGFGGQPAKINEGGVEVDQ